MPENATLIERHDLTDAIAIFRVRTDEPPGGSKPGQYFSLGLIASGTLVQRPYSNAAVPGSQVLEFLIRLVPGGTLTPALWQAPIPTRVHVGRARGVFTLETDDRRAHLFVATGTGLAPFVAMAGALLERPDPPPAVVVHGVAHVAELAYRNHFSNLQALGRLRYVPAISRPMEARNAGWDGTTGRATPALPGLFDDLLDPKATVAYLCGNPGMVDAAGEVLLRIGLPPAAIVLERYWAS
jgi:ferredoxin-NADP reductase